MGRTIVIGDVHGCLDELRALLTRVRFAEGDALVFVGDLVARGPDSTGVLAIARAHAARVVRGNHEERLLAWRRSGGRTKLGRDHMRVASALGRDDWRLIESTKLWIDLPEHGIRVAHAGVVPGAPIEQTPPDALLRMRTIDASGAWNEAADAGPLWGTKYAGPPHVVFGHNARAEPQIHAWATGLDTGCVYGGELTAVVLDEREPMPRGEAARAKLVSVRARRKYYGDEGTPLAR